MTSEACGPCGDPEVEIERKDLRIRGTMGREVKLNTVRVGGWYSNGAGGNSCANPSQPSKLYMDDVAIAKGYIGI